MRTRLHRGLLLALALLIPAALAQSAPLQPAHDDEVVETLPAAAGPAAEQRRLRRALAQSPRDVQTALVLSRSLLTRSQVSGDARLAGQALGVLQPWEGDANAPVDVRLQRATLLQHLHDFEAAAAELESLLKRAPQQAQAWLTLATVRRVQGRYAESDTACARLVDAGQPLLARACHAENRSLRGAQDEARREFETLLRLRPADPAWASWLRTSLGELELRAGRPAAAIGHLRTALSFDDDAYARHALADALIEARRPAEAARLLADDASDAALLRRAIAARALGAPDAASLRDTLGARHAQAAQRPQDVPVHARERARFALDVEGDAAQAVELARANLRTQREAADFVVMHRAAQAAGDAAAQAEVQALAARVGLSDARLAAAGERS